MSRLPFPPCLANRARAHVVNYDFQGMILGVSFNPCSPDCVIADESLDIEDHMELPDGGGIAFQPLAHTEVLIPGLS